MLNTLLSKKIWIGIALFLVLLISVYSALSSKGVPKHTLVFDTVQVGDYHLYSHGFGKFISNQAITLSAPSSSIIKEIYVNSGDQITPGDPLFLLHNPDLERELLTRESELNKAQLQLKKLQADLQQTLLLLENDITDAKDDLTVAQLDFKAQQALREIEIISEIQFNQAQVALNKAHNKVKSLQRRLELTRSNHSQRINIEKLIISQAQRQVEQAQEDLKKLAIVSTSNGIIENIEVNKGDLLSFGQKIAQIKQLKPNLIELKFPAEDAGAIMPKTQVNISYLQHTLTAEVTRVRSELLDGFVVVQLDVSELALPHARNQLEVSAKAVLAIKPDSTFIRRPAYFSHNDDHMFVYRLGQQQLIKQPVSISHFDREFLLITEGVKQGEQILISQLDDLQGQQTINVL